MTDKDNITLPREVVQEALEALELEATSPPLETTAAAMAALRTALAAPKQEQEQEPVRCNPADYCVARHVNLYTVPPNVEALRRENERLREALVRHGKHGVDCDAYRGCTCGLDAALRREEA